MSTLGPLTLTGSVKQNIRKTRSCNFTRDYPSDRRLSVTSESSTQIVRRNVNSSAVSPLSSLPPISNSSSLDRTTTQESTELDPNLLKEFVYGLGRFIYLIVIISVGIVLTLVYSMTTTKYYEPKVIFEIFCFASSSVLLSIILYQLSAFSRQHSRHSAKNNPAPGSEISVIRYLDKITKNSADGLNILLRIGMIAFSLCATILCFLRIIGLIKNGEWDAKQVTRLTMYILQIIFITLQTYFIFKYRASDLRQLYKWADFIQFLLIHLVAVNLNIWFNTVVLEAGELDKVIKKKSNNHLLTSHSNATDTNVTDPLKNVQIHFFAFVIEYTILAAGVLINIHLKLSSKEETSESETPETPPPSSPVSERMVSVLQTLTCPRGQPAVKIFPATESINSISFVPIRSRYNFCTKAHTGFFISLLLAAFYFVYIVCNYMFDINTFPYSIAYLVINIFLHSLAFFLVIIIIFRMALKFRFVEEEDFFVDNFLITISFFAVILFNTFVTLADVRDLILGNYSSLHEQLLKAMLRFIDFFQFFAQTGFILVGVKLRAAAEEQRNMKPGVTVLIILITINLMAWLEESLLFKRYISLTVYIEYFGQSSWTLIASACKPLVVFYRFHVAAMLTEIWTTAYKLEENHESESRRQ